VQMTRRIGRNGAIAQSVSTTPKRAIASALSLSLLHCHGDACGWGGGIGGRGAALEHGSLCTDQQIKHAVFSQHHEVATARSGSVNTVLCVHCPCAITYFKHAVVGVRDVSLCQARKAHVVFRTSSYCCQPLTTIVAVVQL